MYTICFLFLFSLPGEDRSPWDPLDMSTCLRRCPQQRLTHRPSCWERICYLSAPLSCTRVTNRALGMCCNLAECQIALEFSGDRPVREETGTSEGGNDIIMEHVILLRGIIFHNNVDNSLLNQINRVIWLQLLAVFQYVYFHLLFIRFC